MGRLKLVVIAALLSVAIVALVQGLSSPSRRLASSGKVKAVGVGVYWDVACTKSVDCINWGVLEPGETRNVTLYIRNEGNVMAMLAMTTENWSPPEVSQYLELAWDYGGQWLAPSSVLPVTFSLHLAENVQSVNSFSFDIVITAVG